MDGAGKCFKQVRMQFFSHELQSVTFELSVSDLKTMIAKLIKLVRRSETSSSTSGKVAVLKELLFPFVMTEKAVAADTQPWDNSCMAALAAGVVIAVRESPEPAAANSGPADNAGAAANSGAADKGAATNTGSAAVDARAADNEGAAGNAGAAANSGIDDSVGAAASSGTSDKAGAAADAAPEPLAAPEFSKPANRRQVHALKPLPRLPEQPELPERDKASLARQVPPVPMVSQQNLSWLQRLQVLQVALNDATAKKQASAASSVAKQLAAHLTTARQRGMSVSLAAHCEVQAWQEARLYFQIAQN